MNADMLLKQYLAQNRNLDVCKLIKLYELKADERRNRSRVTLSFFGAGLLLAGILILAGCRNGPTNPLLTPAALTGEVAQGVAIGLDVYPEGVHDIKLARDVICAESLKTNLSPSLIVADLAGVGITNSNSKLIVDGALLLYNGVWTLLSTNQLAAQPYLDALCHGLTLGLPSPNPAARKWALTVPHLK